MRKNAILASVAIIVVAAGAYLIWQGNSDSNGVTTTPNPAPSPAPSPTPNVTPAPTPNPTPAPTSQDYKAPFKTLSGKGISVEYPSSWTLTKPLSDDKWGVGSLLSPSTKSKLDAGMLNGYPYDVQVRHSSDLFDLLGNAYTKGTDVTVGGKKGYRVLIMGNGSNEGVVVENNGFYVLDFQPGMGRDLQDEILRHVTFSK
jgi:hypothetical protein